MSRKLCVALALSALLLAPSCYTFRHQVGSGGGLTTKMEERQWFILWGLVPLNEIDSHKMAGEAKDYTVTTEFNVVDVLISALTGWVSIHVQTVKVEK